MASEARVWLEWGPTGAAAFTSRVAVACVVDVLSFSTTVTVAADTGVEVVPLPFADASAHDVARHRRATLAVPRQDAQPGDVSLSPASFRQAHGLTRVVLPSPNGSTVCSLLAEGGAAVVVASLRNRTAVARRLAETGGDVLVVPAGERWPDGSLRPAIEDLWGAGAVVDALLSLGMIEASDEAQAAAAAYRLVEHRLGGALAGCPSGQELIGQGYALDVTIAAELDASAAVPRLVDGVLTPSSLAPVRARR